MWPKYVGRSRDQSPIEIGGTVYDPRHGGLWRYGEGRRIGELLKLDCSSGLCRPLIFRQILDIIEFILMCPAIGKLGPIKIDDGVDYSTIIGCQVGQLELLSTKLEAGIPSC